MRYAKLKSTGRIVATQSGGNPDTDDLDVFASGVGYPVDQLEVGYESDEVVSEWTEAQNEAERTYVDKRKAEYPTIAELVVALYDTDDKADIEKLRAEVKAKYPKE